MPGLVDKFKRILDDERARLKEERVADDIRTSPKYKPMLDKLEELYNKRRVLELELANCEHNIDACLVFIQMVREKEELEKAKFEKD